MGERVGKAQDVGALAGWMLSALCGWQAFGMADHFRNDPGMIRGGEKAVLVTVSGLVLLALSLVLAAGALARVVGAGEPFAGPIVSVVLGATMIGLFVIFCGWGVSLTKNQGIAAVLILMLPYFLGGSLVLLRGRHRQERALAVA